MRTGLFLCRADEAGIKSLDVDAIAERHRSLASVKVFDEFFCKEAIQQMVGEARSKRLEGVVLAGYSPHYFRDTLAAYRLIVRLEEAGVNANRIAFANLREQCALPNRDEPAGANRKAALMVEKALARVRLSPAAESVLVAPHRAVLVIGATLAGLVGAYRASRLGYRVFVLDRATELAGETRDKGHAMQLAPALTELELNPRVEFLWDSDVDDVSGWCGDYTVEVSRRGGEGKQKITVGGILLAAASDAAWAAELAPKLHINLGEEGAIDTRNEITMATRTEEDGILTVPPGRGENVLRSEAEAASTAITVLDGILSANEIIHPLRMTNVDKALCGACGTCVKTCAFRACSIDAAERVAKVDERRCKACGNCVTACPANARDLATYTSEYVAESIKIYSQFERNGSPRVLCLLCNGCGYSAADAAGRDGFRYPASVLPVRVACGGRVDTQHILEAFQCDFDGVLLTVCREGHCHNIVGNVDMNRRLNLFRTVLRSRKLNSERLRILEIAPFEGKKFADETTRFVQELKTIEPITRGA